MAFLVLALAGTVVGAAVVLGSGQEPPARVVATAAPEPPTGPPLDLAALQADLEATEAPAPEMRFGVLDKQEAIQIERQARADARALQELAAQQAAAFEFAAALDAAADAPPATTPAPTGPPPTTEPPASVPPTTTGGGGGGGGDGLTLYEKLDNIATCESGQNTQAYNPNGPYYGAFQFLWETWQRYGGGGDRPRAIFEHSYAQQREVAANLARARGFAGSWPTCAARYGYS